MRNPLLRSGAVEMPLPVVGDQEFGGSALRVTLANTVVCGVKL